MNSEIKLNAKSPFMYGSIAKPIVKSFDDFDERIFLEIISRLPTKISDVEHDLLEKKFNLNLDKFSGAYAAKDCGKILSNYYESCIIDACYI